MGEGGGGGVRELRFNPASTGLFLSRCSTGEGCFPSPCALTPLPLKLDLPDFVWIYRG